VRKAKSFAGKGRAVLNQRVKTKRILLQALLAFLFARPAYASATVPLEASFLNPPYSAKPDTWWHWMNGNITTPGVAADLEAMKQIGLDGIRTEYKNVKEV
jgi:alpha-L-rhamnosidase